MEESGAPKQEVMGGSSIDDLLGPHEGILVKQTMKGCLQECLGCEAKSEYKVAPLDWNHITEGYKADETAMAQADTMYILENSNCCWRTCYRDGRPFNMEVFAGGEPGGPPVGSFLKPCGLPLNVNVPINDKGDTCPVPCCCMLPKVDTKGPGGEDLGSESRYIQDINLCVPKLQYSEKGQIVYVMKPETCCGGCCVSCGCGGKGCIYIPFYFLDPNTGEPMGGYTEQAPQIRKVWSGWKKECCSTADNFAIRFPQGIENNRKFGLLGMTMLIDFTVFERQQEK